MNLNIAEELKNVPEAKVEAPKEAISAESQEATLTAKAEGAEASLQDEINSMEDMLASMPDMDAETVAMMRGQIDEMKTELEEGGMRTAPGEPSMRDFKMRLAQRQEELKNAVPKSRDADNIQHTIWQTEAQIRDLQWQHNQKKNPQG